MKSTITPAQYTELRKALDISQDTLARLLGVNIRTVQRRETGELPIDLEAKLAISFISTNENLWRPIVYKYVRGQRIQPFAERGSAPHSPAR